VTVKKRQTIMANPLDEIVLTVRPAQRKAKKASTTPSKKIEKSAPISVRRPRKASSASLKLSSAIADEDISSVKENSAESKVDYSKNKSSSLHEFHSLSAEEIFMEESGSRDLVMIKPLSSDLRLMRANKCVLLWSSVSVPISLIPFVVLDVAATIAIQVKMIKDICDLYNIPFKNENARAFISGLVGGGCCNHRFLWPQKCVAQKHATHWQYCSLFGAAGAWFFYNLCIRTSLYKASGGGWCFN
jgi:hypothetical protein